MKALILGMFPIKGSVKSRLYSILALFLIFYGIILAFIESKKAII